MSSVGLSTKIKKNDLAYLQHKINVSVSAQDKVISIIFHL